MPKYERGDPRQTVDTVIALAAGFTCLLEVIRERDPRFAAEFAARLRQASARQTGYETELKNVLLMLDEWADHLTLPMRPTSPDNEP